MTDMKDVGRHYDAVDFPKGPAIYSSAGLYEAMLGLGEFSIRDRPYRILDAMCGAGLVGKEISNRLKSKDVPHIVHYADVTEKKLRELKKEGNNTTLANVHRLPYLAGSFDRVYARFGVKNYPRDQQVMIFTNFRNAMIGKGVFVLCDMESPEEAYEFMQAERREKHKYTRLEGSEPHIPTRQMWFRLLREGGLKPKAAVETKSYVTTTDWVKSNQMTVEDLEKMNAFLLAAPEAAKRALNIREEDDIVKIDYPVVVISAVPL